jgi:D-alanyl-lipoteichoic acid acyltransferase DltB (MBOAT superfamily)
MTVSLLHNFMVFIRQTTYHSACSCFCLHYPSCKPDVYGAIFLDQLFLCLSDFAVFLVMSCKQHDWKKMSDIKWALIFSTIFFCTFANQRSLQHDFTLNVHRSSCVMFLLLSDFRKNWISLTDFSTDLECKMSQVSEGVPCRQTDRVKDRHAEAKSLLAVVMEIWIHTAVNRCMYESLCRIGLVVQHMDYPSYSHWQEAQKEMLVLDNQRTECEHSF